MIQQAMTGMQQPQGGAGPGVPTTGQAAGAAAGMAAAGSGSGLDFGDLAPSSVDPRQIVRTVAQGAGWQISESGDVWNIVVPIGALRKQTVSVNFAAKDEEGHAVIAFSSICGPASERNAMALLRYNTKMVHGAFAVQQTSAGEMIVVQANQLADTADPLEVTRVMTAVAWQADKVEQKLGGGDNY